MPKSAGLRLVLTSLLLFATKALYEKRASSNEHEWQAKEETRSESTTISAVTAKTEKSKVRSNEIFMTQWK